MNNTLPNEAGPKLMYVVVCKRPDVWLEVARLSQYMEDQAKSSWIFLKHGKRYNAETKLMGIDFSIPSARKICLGRPSDSDSAGCKVDNRIITGFLYP